jgi:benzoyl-CoA reductase/2-hydroxyglutaryl-CoA dehydratase subunit BcrC/BadD/HgdB
MWGIGLPPWHTLKIFNHFENHGAVGVVEYFYRAWESPKMFDIPTGLHPLEHIARRYLDSWTFNHEKAKAGCGEPIAQCLLDWIDAYKIDKYVEHMSASCRLWSVGQLHYANIIRDYRKDLPILVWSSDMIDIRTFNEAQVKAQVDAFVEVMESHKRRRL